MRWLTTCGLIVSLALTGCGPGDNSAPEPTDTSSIHIEPATTEPATPENDRPAIGIPGMTVQSAGNEPRQVVRYHSEPGAEIQRRISTVMRLDQKLEETTIPEVFPVMHLTMRSVTGADSGTDVISSRYIFTEHEVEENAALPESKVDMVRGMLSQAVGITRESRIASTGRVEEQKLNTTGLSREMRRHVEALIAAVGVMTPVFPEQAIGVNAQWVVTQTITQGDHTIQQTVSYRMLARDGDTVTLSYQVWHQADPQKLEALQGVINRLTLLTFKGEGSGEIVIDLSQLLPITADGSMTTESTVSLGDGRLLKAKRHVVNKIGPAETTG